MNIILNSKDINIQKRIMAEDIKVSKSIKDLKNRAMKQKDLSDKKSADLNKEKVMIEK